MAVEVVLRPTSKLGEGSLTRGVESQETLSSEAVAALQQNVVYLCEQIWNGDIPDEHLDLVAEELVTLAEGLLDQPGMARLFAHYPLATAYATLNMPPAAIDRIVMEGIVELDAAIDELRNDIPKNERVIIALSDARSALKGLKSESPVRIVA